MRTSYAFSWPGRFIEHVWTFRYSSILGVGNVVLRAYGYVNRERINADDGHLYLSPPHLDSFALWLQLLRNIVNLAMMDFPVDRVKDHLFKSIDRAPLPVLLKVLKDPAYARSRTKSSDFASGPYGISKHSLSEIIL